jgi:hypothetical protein
MSRSCEFAAEGAVESSVRDSYACTLHATLPSALRTCAAVNQPLAHALQPQKLGAGTSALAPSCKTFAWCCLCVQADLREQHSLASSLLNLGDQFAVHLPALLWSSPLLPALLELASACVRLREADPVSHALALLAHCISAHEREDEDGTLQQVGGRAGRGTVVACRSAERSSRRAERSSPGSCGSFVALLLHCGPAFCFPAHDAGPADRPACAPGFGNVPILLTAPRRSPAGAPGCRECDTAGARPGARARAAGG